MSINLSNPSFLKKGVSHQTSASRYLLITSVKSSILVSGKLGFIARATTTTNPPTSYYVMISVYQAPNGGAITLGDIQPINL